MTFWIYNMGLGVPMSPVGLESKLKPQKVESSKEIDAIDVSKNEKRTEATQENVTRQPAKSTEHEKILNYLAPEDEQKRRQVFFAEQIMSSPVQCLAPHTLFHEAQEHFIKYRFRHFPVLEENKTLVGIVSDRDMLNTAAASNLDQLKSTEINQLMQSEVLTASTNTTIRELCEAMLQRHISAIPITDENANLLGIVSRSDILNCLVKQGPLELWV